MPGNWATSHTDAHCCGLCLLLTSNSGEQSKMSLVCISTKHWFLSDFEHLTKLINYLIELLLSQVRVKEAYGDEVESLCVAIQVMDGIEQTPCMRVRNQS